MSSPPIGIWFIGAWGGVATTSVVGLAALQEKLAGETALVSALPQFTSLNLADWEQFVVGGHEIRRTGYALEARKLHDESRVFNREVLSGIADRLDEFDCNVRTGTLLNVGPTIESLASDDALATKGERPRQAIDRLSNDLQAFREQHNLAHVIVANVSSTEPPPAEDLSRLSWQELSERLDHNEPLLPASALYAVAAMRTECSYLNFTPSVGSNLPALDALAREQGVLHMGRDGKTGETLMKSVLAPMFAARNLKVLSWVGHNIFGNMDARVLDDPVNKASKARSKDHLLTEILGYKPQTLVSIELIESMADWKTAWDHIHFEGFLGTQMTLQFVWQGCDSLLAAPLVLDLVRFTERESRRGTSGVMTHLASFFKSPMGESVPPEFGRQFEVLLEWARDLGDGQSSVVSGQ